MLVSLTWSFSNAAVYFYLLKEVMYCSFPFRVMIVLVLPFLAKAFQTMAPQTGSCPWSAIPSCSSLLLCSSRLRSDQHCAPIPGLLPVLLLRCPSASSRSYSDELGQLHRSPCARHRVHCTLPPLALPAGGSPGDTSTDYSAPAPAPPRRASSLAPPRCCDLRVQRVLNRL